MQEQAATECDLKAINRYTLRELKEEEVFIFSAKFIDSEPTSNGRVWTREWQEAAINRKLFDGVPFMADHENSLSMKIGTVYSAELREDGIHGKVFIPLDEQGKQSREAIENSRIRSVSINADGESKKVGDLTHILPSESQRVYEVSGVQIPGCKTCVITEKTPSGVCESSTDDSMREFAISQLADLQDDYVRFAGFTLGTIDREVYKHVAESLDPLTLKTITNDMREAYSKGQKETVEHGTIEQIQKGLQDINRMKGV